MFKRLILHDLPSGNFESVGITITDSDTVFDAEPIINPCTSCFGCWIKTPGECVISDRGKGFANLIAKNDEFVVISRMTFGGFSPSVKAVLDRSIGHILPFFKIVQGETHHKARCKNKFNLRCIFYGNDISDFDKDTARKLIAANALNLTADTHTIGFHEKVTASGDVV